MKSTLRAAGSLAAILAVAGVLLVGSQAIRQTPKAAVISPSPVARSQADAFPTATPACVDGENSHCHPPCASTDPALCNPPCDGLQWPGQCIAPVSSLPTSDPNATSAGTVAPAGTIQASVVTFSTGEKVGVTVAVLSGGNWVSGAAVTVHCSGSGWDVTTAGTTAPIGSWPVPGNGPRPPTAPATFFWAQLSGPGSGKAYTCQVTADYNGLSTSVSLNGTA